MSTLTSFRSPGLLPFMRTHRRATGEQKNMHNVRFVRRWCFLEGTSPEKIFSMFHNQEQVFHYTEHQDRVFISIDPKKCPMTLPGGMDKLLSTTSCFRRRRFYLNPPRKRLITFMTGGSAVDGMVGQAICCLVWPHPKAYQTCPEPLRWLYASWE